DGLVTVTDDEVATAILALIEQHKMICEGAGAVSVAAAMFEKIDLKGKKVCCLLSGGNIDVNILSRVISRGLLKAGRTAELTIALIDKPGQLTGVSRIISAHGGNVIGVFHDQGEADMAINSCFLKVKMETRDAAQVQEIRDALIEEGFHLV
ncbi:MAG: threonine ammonia-lyase, partial [Oscillospiraceae bacterium]|nr:threonine ammonia-lyase [Oscillospiraceae bacterium]